MKCVKCKQEINIDDNFCENCGYDLKNIQKNLNENIIPDTKNISKSLNNNTLVEAKKDNIKPFKSKNEIILLIGNLIITPFTVFYVLAPIISILGAFMADIVFGVFIVMFGGEWGIFLSSAIEESSKYESPAAISIVILIIFKP